MRLAPRNMWKETIVEGNYVESNYVESNSVERNEGNMTLNPNLNLSVIDMEQLLYSLAV